MISWGMVSSAMMFVTRRRLFYALRFLLGVAEAGFFPGIIFYLTHWFPARERARDDRAVHDGDADRRRRSAGRCPGALLSLARRRRPGRLAVAVPARRPAGDRARRVVLRFCPTAPRTRRGCRRDERAALVAGLAARATRRGRRDHRRGAFANARTWLLALVYFRSRWRCTASASGCRSCEGGVGPARISGWASSRRFLMPWPRWR